MPQPPPAQPDYLEAFGVAVACLLPVFPASWKAASLRGDTFKKWAERVEVAHAGLTERAKEELLRLQTEIGRALGSPAGEFSPAEIIADPAPLVAGANTCADILRARDKLRSRFRRHRQLGRALLAAVVVYVIGWVLATLHYTAVQRLILHRICYTPTMNLNDMENIAWAAGLFEGEGCFTVSTSRGKYKIPRVKLRSTDEDVVRKFHAIVGCGVVREDSYFQRTQGNKVQWEWYARKHEVVQVIDLLLPWLGERRTERAKEVRSVATIKEDHPNA